MTDTRPTLVRGPDGALYFIPAEELARYLVPQQEAARLEETIRSLGQQAEVGGFDFDNPHDVSALLGLATPTPASQTVVDGNGREFPGLVY